MKKFLSFEKINNTESESVFIFFPAHQVPEIILNECSKNTENALIEWFEKKPQDNLRKPKYT
jgi:hypothetical protein